ncbi:hypothetical protein SAMN05518672_1011060 [Chitinophaga sp. CF118]|nr:hypothetical protein SAMN05518672_1011060 [Chitinophaga sp. CF118]
MADYRTFFDGNGDITIFDFYFCGNGWLALNIA